MYKRIFLLVFILKFSIGFSQFQLSENAEISIVSIGPGKELYDSFGHSAFRVTDPGNNRDLIFNYGTFDFETPNFILKFARGKLPYALSVRDYQGFLNAYIRENRTFVEQELDLTYGEKTKLFNFLLKNAQPENKEYQYDFFYDNCATKIRDVLKEALGNDLTYKDGYAPEQFTFRKLIQQRLDLNSWGSLGIDVALGAVIDRTASQWEHQYLPEYVHDAATFATLNNDGIERPLVRKETVVFQSTGSNKTKTFFLFTPLAVFGIIGLLIIGVTYRDFKRNKRTKWLDGVLFFATGFVGILLLLLWVGTDHTATANNYNMLWAFPLNLLFFTLISKTQPKKWLYRYVFFLILLIALLTFHWITGVQIFSIGFIPLIIALAIRWIYLATSLKKEN